ncbi:hypothetical protein MLD38_032498 [Melastoma candidum]|uniref:Uncharacterized protein n=1 Tax=Melastoma candidum TaxID=119954 RepID=A0ACB9M682_9MYRT|nr:hypothetical protein MLD38_032498 [Melastoma candidum]
MREMRNLSLLEHPDRGIGDASFHRDVKLAEEVKERLSKIDPENSGYHVSLSTLVLPLKSGRTWLRIAEEAYEKLREITSRLRIEAGHTPEADKTVLHDIEEKEKEDSVTRHSEKLVAAFRMASMHKGSNVRVVKNSRICRDCHKFMKLVSRVYLYTRETYSGWLD